MRSRAPGRTGFVKLAESESQIKTLEIEVQDLEAKLAKLRNSLSALTLTTSTAGEVLYAVDDWSGRKVQVGDTVFTTSRVAHPRYVLARGPGLDQRNAHSAHHDRRERRSSLDAYPERHFKGIILEIWKSADARRRWGRAHYFKVRIEMEKLDPEIMKPGMSVKCEVRDLLYEDVLLVSLEMALFDGQSFWTPARARRAAETQGSRLQ